MDIGVHGETRGWQDAFAIQRLLAFQAGGFHQTQPFFYAAGFCGVAIAVVIDDSFAPGAAEIGIFATRENGRIFNRDAALIVVAIERPSLELAASELAFVHSQVERMAMVIAFFADLAEARGEIAISGRG